MQMNKILSLLVLIFLMAACATGGSDSENKEESNFPEMTAEDAVKFEQYMVAGETLYLQYCSTCHQAMGTGLANLYPPLKESDYMQEHYEEIFCIIRNGKSGPIEVNGITYNNMMPALPMLTDLEIAEITTYIYNSWGNSRGLIPVSEATRILANCETGE
jgi:mono/diheme cytochrome c family protein